MRLRLRLLFAAIFTFSAETIIDQVAANQQKLYTPLSALDKYGNSKQLQNAEEAANKHGMPIIAATASEGAVVVAAVFEKKPGIISELKLLHRISLRNSHTIGIACSGIKADSKWLIDTLRSYQKRTWERYGLENLSIERIQYALLIMLSNFMGYDRKEELHDGLLDLSKESWARPLGVSVLIASFGNPINIIQPSGISEQYHAYAIGRYCREINEKLEQRYEPNQPTEDVKMLLRNIMEEIQEKVGGQDSTFITVEVLKEGEIIRNQIK